MADRLSSGEVPNPTWQTTEGRSWAVRPDILLDSAIKWPDDAVKIQNRLRRDGHWAAIGLAGGPDPMPVTGTIFADADSPGAADLVSEARAREGFTPIAVLEVVVVPAGYDETDW